ncbi:MAG: tRNA (adenosine(37)-N6)-threonylcarbamoyltransferase complex ATPase subunit type 1 TsaE [Steroidobacteraceae bacterium]|jgi:tRNA threonylcarbamoyladenosine biosynthesis protein TsaE
MRVELADEAATLELGARLALAIPPSPDEALKVALHGDLGAGKTTLTRGFLRSLGVAGSVRSPTFSLLESYELDRLTVVHLDLYRLRDAGDVRALGLADHDHRGCLWMVEWPERAAGALGRFDLEVTLQVVGDGRLAELSAGTEAGRQWLQAL